MSEEADHRYPTMEEFATGVWPEQPVAAPTKGRGAPRLRPKVAADVPTQITGAPTTPLPAKGAARPPRPARKGSRIGLLVGVVIVAAAGCGGYFALRSAPRREPPGGRRPAAPRAETRRIQDRGRV